MIVFKQNMGACLRFCTQKEVHIARGTLLERDVLVQNVITHQSVRLRFTIIKEKKSY